MKSSNALVFNLDKSLISKEVSLLQQPAELSPSKQESGLTDYMDASQNEAAQHQSSVSQDLASKSVSQVNDSFVKADKQPVEGTNQFGYNELENDFAKVLNGQLEEEEYFEEDSSDINSLSIESSISKKLLKEESFTQKQKENRDKSVNVEDVDEDELSLKEVEVKIPNFKAIIKESENDENKDISQI